MSQTEQKIDRLTQILEGFIASQNGVNNAQQSFNEEQRIFNEEQKSFNTRIEAKIDKSQYYLEEALANDAKMFFEEQTKQGSRLRMLDDEVANLKSNVHEMSLQIGALQKV